MTGVMFRTGRPTTVLIILDSVGVTMGMYGYTMSLRLHLPRIYAWVLSILPSSKYSPPASCWTDSSGPDAYWLWVLYVHYRAPAFQHLVVSQMVVREAARSHCTN